MSMMMEWTRWSEVYVLKNDFIPLVASRHSHFLKFGEGLLPRIL